MTRHDSGEEGARLGLFAVEEEIREEVASWKRGVAR
jgi:hypothetical protein